MSRQLFSKIIIGFSGIIAISGIFCSITYYNLNKIAESQQKLVQTQEVHHNIQNILSEIQNLELEQRDYLITKDQTELETHNATIQKINQKINSLDNLPEIIPNQNLWINALKQAVQEHLEVSQTIVELESIKNLGNVQKKLLIIRRKEHKNIDKHSQISGDLESLVEQALTAESVKTQTILQRAFFYFGLAICLSVLILAKVYSLIAQEIKLQKLIEQTLQERLNVVEAAIDGIALLNENGEYIYLNQSHAKIFGYQYQNELLNQNWRQLYYPEEIERLEREVFPLLQQKRHWRGEASGKRKDGSQFAEEVSLSLTEDNKLICVCRDISESKQSQALLDEANDQLLAKVRELEEYNQEILLVAEMKEILQGCLTIDEAKSALPILLQRLFPQISGNIFFYNHDNGLLESGASWNDETDKNFDHFTTQDCWALRHSKSYYLDYSQPGLKCKHLHADSSSGESLCVPMMAQGEILGILNLNSSGLRQLTPSKQKLAETIAANFALTIANLKLRSRLEEESIRDPLTGLFNRRYMEESLQREIYKCDRQQEFLAIIMMDIDHFKQFNDSYGHLIGDALLRELGAFLQTNIRDSDIACRYGGEELIVIMPETPLEFAQQRGEQIRQEVKNIQLKCEPQIDLTISLSLGVACFPLHGLTAQEVIKAADTALYRAKTEGRDRIMVFT
jgi:diguanylate cyclase (GGDEF)-like protein/PAS domain S-box-containing protein